MNWKLGGNKRIGEASDRQPDVEIERIKIREIDKPIIEEFIRSELKRIQKIEQNYWQERWANPEISDFYHKISACVQIDENSKTAWVHEKHPSYSAFELRQIEAKIIEIGDWEITIDFDVVQSAWDVIHTEFCRFLHEIKELAVSLPRIDNLRNYLKSAGGWKLYKFAKIYNWGGNSYKFYCYRIRGNKTEFKGGYVEFDKSHNPNVWLFTDIENFIQSNYEPLIYKEGN